MNAGQALSGAAGHGAFALAGAAGGAVGGAARYEACLAELLEIEGGFSNDPADRGGATMCGVTYQTYNAYRDAIGQPRQDVRRITVPEIRDIFWRYYWTPSQAGSMPPGLDRCVFDFAVNSGPVQALRTLQRVLGAPADGHYGPVTGQAVVRAHIPTLVRSYVAARRQFGRALPNYWRFGRGWEARWNRIERLALYDAGAQAWAAEVNATGDTSLPADPHDRSAEQGRAIAEAPRPPIVAEIGAGGTGASAIGTSMPRIFSQSMVGGRFSVTAFLIALASEPWFWAGVALIWATVAFYLWRRKFSGAMQ